MDYLGGPNVISRILKKIGKAKKKKKNRKGRKGEEKDVM